MVETRKLAAILCSDVVGYSRLAGADEDRILARLRALRSDLIDPTIAVHHGRIVKRTGDGSLVEFRSVVDAVRCAIEVQNGMVERNAGLPQERRIDFRIGIHLGDVVEEEDGDLMGDGVNIAARLEGIAQPGMICLSEQAYWQVKGRLDIAVTDLGPTQLKNIAEPVRAYSLEVGVPAHAKPALPATHVKPAAPRKRSALAPIALTIAAVFVVVAGGAAWYFVGGSKSAATVAQPGAALPTPAEPAKPLPHLSIVVLPFANLSGDATQEYFADGVTESLTTDLSRISGSFVIARDTAFAFKGKNVDAKDIGKQLGVRYVLEGSVQRDPSRVRVNSQLIDAETGGHLWADRFDKPPGDLFALQDEIVAALASQLNTELISNEARHAEHAPNPDSMDLYFQGMAEIDKGFNPENMAQARGFFERALALDRDNLDALLQKARVDMNLMIYQNNSKDERAGIYATAEATVTHVLSLAPNNASAHFEIGRILVDTNRRAEGMAELERALALDPNFASARSLIGAAKILDGRAEETEAQEKEALRLSPRDPIAYWWLFHIANSKVYLGAYEQAVTWYKRSLEMNRNWPPAHFGFASALELLGRHDEARAEVQTGLAFSPTFTIRTCCVSAESDNPVFLKQRERVLQAMRRAGVPEE